MGIIYGMLAILFALVIALFILVLKYRSDVGFLKDMFEVNNGYVKECAEDWSMAIKLCRDVCERNEELCKKVNE